jgi:RNA polymerase sigma-70 factor (ECF subfamily)
MSEEEFSAEVERRREALIGVAAQTLKCEEAAKDAVQVATIRVWKNIASFDPKKGSLGTLLTTAVKRVALYLVISHKRRLVAMERFWGNIIPERPRKADPRLDKLMAALGELPEVKRALLHKRFFEGKTLAVIANEVGLSKSATQARLHRAEVLCDSASKLHFDISQRKNNSLLPPAEPIQKMFCIAE